MPLCLHRLDSSGLGKNSLTSELVFATPSSWGLSNPQFLRRVGLRVTKQLQLRLLLVVASSSIL
jgi:hypothetical protein